MFQPVLICPLSPSYDVAPESFFRVCKRPHQHGHGGGAAFAVDNIPSTSSGLDNLFRQSVVHDHLGHEGQLRRQQVLQEWLGTSDAVQTYIATPRSIYHDLPDPEGVLSGIERSHIHQHIIRTLRHVDGAHSGLIRESGHVLTSSIFKAVLFLSCRALES